MCGIIGGIGEDLHSDLFYSGLNVMKYRGPDAQNVLDHKNVYLGHNRLSIIDLNIESNQPFVIDDYILVFNGEIYNYLDLKEHLSNLGVSFVTKSDTEVLLRWLIEFGIDRISEVEGMFAFAFLDKKNETLTLCRDCLGIKPLYTCLNDNKLFFASEIKAIHEMEPKSKKIDEDLISEYLLNGFIYEPETGFEKIHKVQPGTYEIYNFEAKILRKSKYWDLNELTTNFKKSTSIYKAIKKSISSHLISDVPVGLFFSGGVDSTILLTETKSAITPITIKSDEDDYKEAGMTSDFQYAKMISEILSTPCDSVSLKSNTSFLEKIDIVAKGNEELVADFTYISSLSLSMASKKEGYTVMLSGMGADEIFAGYPRYRLVRYEKIFKLANPFIKLLGKHKSFSKKVDRFRTFFKEKNFISKYTALVGYFSESDVRELTGSDQGVTRYHNKLNELIQSINTSSNLKKAMYLDLHGYLSHNFMVSDKSSMKASIEVRVPLATKSLFERTWLMKDNQLINLRFTKIPLRRFLKDVIPKKIINRRKAGFNSPIDNEIKKLGFEKIISILKANGLFSFLNESIAVKLVDEHFAGSKNNTYKIYQLLHLSFWLKSFSTKN